MRYLYGDSAPFPLGYNFLETLEAFMEAATRIVQLDLDSSGLKRQIEDIGAGRVKGLEALEQFHTVVMRAVQDTAQKVQHAHALDYARVLGDFAAKYVDDHRKTTLASNEVELTQLRAETDKRTAEQRALLDGFLKLARLPVSSTRFSMRLTGEGKEARHTINAVFDNPEGIQTAFTLASVRVPAWNAPRKVSDFAEGVELMVGVEKSWLRGTVSPKQLAVDEWVITSFDLSEDQFELVLRRKLAEKDSLSFHVRRTEAGLGGMVEHPGVAGAEALPGTLGSQDLAQLDRIWQALRVAMRDLTEHKEQLLAVNLDGQAVFEGGLVVPFVVRLVGMFAPTVQEIARRSPNEFELTLKRETEGNRREELYLRKEQLTSRLQPLAAAGRQVFAPLGLDSWVPGTTHAPPPVSAPGSNRVLPQS
jgi:hypothetical protein